MSPAFPRHFMARLFVPMSLCCVACLFGSIGCSKEDVKKAFDDAAAKTKELAAPVVKQIEDVLPETGSVVLEMTPSVEMDAASVDVFAVLDGRPAVVQVLTYDPTSSSRSYPCLMIHGTTTLTSASMLSGQSVDCDMYFQSSATSPIAITGPGSLVTVTFGPYDAESQTLHASIGAAELIGSDGKKVLLDGGVLVAVVNGEGS